MRITKKIISLLLVVSMLASFFAMTGFEASAALTGQQKTDFGLHFDDTTRKFKVLQLADIQTDVGDSNISTATKETIRMAMERYEPDLILLSGDQTQGGSGILTSLSDWKSSINAVFNTFTPYMSADCKVVAVPGNHEYDYDNLGDQWDYYNSQSWYLDWDNNFSTVDLNGEPGAGNVTISAKSNDTAVALNIALFNSKGDDEDGYLRPGGDDDDAYQQIVDWYTATNNTLASSAYSYKAQVTGAGTAYVPAFGMQHVILQEIYDSIEACSSTEGVIAAQDHDYSNLLDADYIRFKTNLSYTGVLGEGPCPSTLAKGSTSALYHALVDPGNFLGMCFGHDHLNTFDITDANGFRFLMGGALTSENYNNGNPNVRYFEFTLDDATGDVDMRSETKSYNEMTVTALENMDEDRIEAINSDGVQLVNTLSVPKTVFVGSTENNSDPRAVQKFGTAVQPLLLDYQSKQYYEQDLAVSFCLPAGATVTEFSVKQGKGGGTAVTMTDNGTETTDEGTLYKYTIATSNNLTDGDTLLYTVKYTTSSGDSYEIYNSSAVENIKMPAGYTDWFRSWRRSNNSSNYCDLHYVATLSGNNTYSTGRDTSTNSSGFVSNIHYNYSSPGSDVDTMWVNHNGDSRYSMYFWSPSRVQETSLISKRSITNPPRTDIYLDVSAMEAVSSTDDRLDTGARIDFWMPMTQGRGFTHYVAGIGFYEDDQDFVYNGETIDPNDSYANYETALDAEENSMSSGVSDDATVFLYNSYAGQQAYAGLGTTHVNHNNDDSNKLGKLQSETVGYPLVVDSESDALALNGVGMTMFTGVRVKGADSNGARQLNYAIAPYYLYFHVYDKGELTELTIGELMNPRLRTDYPNASDLLWSAYIDAYKNAVACYAQVKTDQATMDDCCETLNNAIVALLNSNKGTPDKSNLLEGTSKFDSIAVPPIIYVSGDQIQSAFPYTDRTIAFDVPENATNVSCIVVNESNDNVNSAVKLTKLSTSTGTHFEYEVNGYNSSDKTGTATAGGAIYYKLSYTLPQDKNGDDANDVYTQYAASYVKAVPYTEGMWVSRTVRHLYYGGNYSLSTTNIHTATSLSFSSLLGYRGVSGIMSLSNGIQGNSFDSTVVNGTKNNVTYSGDVGYAIGTTESGKSSGFAASNRVLFFQDRSGPNLKAKNWANSSATNPYWNGTNNYSTDSTNNSSSANGSKEYVVANIYFDPQAAGAANKAPLKLSITTSDTEHDDGAVIYKYWDQNPYIDFSYTAVDGSNKSQAVAYYSGDTASADATISAQRAIAKSGLFNHSAITNISSWATDGTVTLNDNNVYAATLTTINNLNWYGTPNYNTDGVLTSYNSGYNIGNGRHADYARLIVMGEKSFDESHGGASHTGYNNANVGFAFAINRVDRSGAHQTIKWITGAELVDPSALFNETDMDPEWWSKWRTEVMEAYIACGNLWGSDYNPYAENNIVSLWQNAIYKDADYSELVSLVESITSQGLSTGSKEHIVDYSSIKYTVNSGDDSRYVGQKYDRTMFVNNAADLIATIKNRTSVYGDVDENKNPVSDANANFHLAHLDIRFQKYINAYVEEIQKAYDMLRLKTADYTTFDKYTNYYNAADDTILFMRDEYAGYANDLAARNYANEKSLASAMFTAASRKAFVDSLNIPRDLKKPSETMVVGSLPRIYPATYTYYNVSSPDTTDCLYNKARDAYEALEFRKAGEYYSANGTYTEGGVTYYANYNKQDKGSGYIYSPVFTTSYNTLTADIVNAGYVVTDTKVKPTYTAGNNGDTNGNGTYDAGEIWVANGLGEYIKAINPWTDASWGGASYGFKNAYEEHLVNATSTYQSTNASDKWVLALYVEAEILPDIAAVDYYYEKLVPSSYDMSQLEIQQHSYAEYEKGGSGYENLESYVIYDENGVQLTDGAQWYTADTWAEYQTAKTVQPSIIEGATLAENQDAINYMTQVVYQKRAALQLRPMTDYRTDTNTFDAVTVETDIIDMSQYDSANPEKELDVLIPSGTTYAAANNFEAINDIIGYYNALIANQYVGVFASRYPVPQDRSSVEGNSILYKKHYFYKEKYRNDLAAMASLINGYADKPMATNIANYIAAVEDFKNMFGTRDSNLNGADYQTLNLLLNKAWLPKYEQYGEGNRPENSWALGMNFTGEKWYTTDSWTEYYNAREAAVKFYVDQTTYSTKSGYDQAYGDSGTNGIATNGLLVDRQGSNSTNVQGSINKAAYDLLVAYYKLQLKKVSEYKNEDYDNAIAGVTGTYADINTALDAALDAKAEEKIGVVVVDQATGTLKTVEKSIYGDKAIDDVRALENTILALENDNLGDKYNEYLAAVKAYKDAIDNLEQVKVDYEGWNGIFTYLNTKAGGVHEITDTGTMANYFNAVYSGYQTAKPYAENGTSIDDILKDKATIDKYTPNISDGQADMNGLVTALYNELNAAVLVPKQVTGAAAAARVKINEGTKDAYDPLQLNGRTHVSTITKYTAASVAAVEAEITRVEGLSTSLWATDPQNTGYATAVTVIDGKWADDIWAAAGLMTDACFKDSTQGHDYSTNPDTRYLLVEGGQFTDALEDALTYAKAALYKNTATVTTDENGKEITTYEFEYDEDGNKIVKTVDVLKGDGTVEPYDLYTSESVAELVAAIAKGESVTTETEQTVIDGYVFEILEHTDDSIKLLNSEGGYYGQLLDTAKDEGLEHNPANYTYFGEELGLTFKTDSAAAQTLVNSVWVDEDANKEYELHNTNGSTYFDNWDPYFKAYGNATDLDRKLTTEHQSVINTHTTTVYATRNALKWKGIDEKTQKQIDSIKNTINGLNQEQYEVLTFTNSKLVTLDDGTKALTAPSIGRKTASPYGDLSHITNLWDAFSKDYLEAEGIDITYQAEMLAKLDKISEEIQKLETKGFDLSADNEFTEGVRNLVNNFIAGTYTFNGLSSADGVGKYVADYQTVANEESVSAEEQLIRSEQQREIQKKLNAIYTIIGSGMPVGKEYDDYSTGVLVQYDTAIEAVNALAEDLYTYLTGTPAQYAGFALDMRQDMLDFFNATVTSKVDEIIFANSPVFEKTQNVFAESTIENVNNAINDTFTVKESWPAISQLDKSVGMSSAINETYDYMSDMIYMLDEDGNMITRIDDDGNEENVYNPTMLLLAIVGANSSTYTDNVRGCNTHMVEYLNWLTTTAYYTNADGNVYILADLGDMKPFGEDVKFAYAMDKGDGFDGEWYETRFECGDVMGNEGARYYRAEIVDTNAEAITGSDYKGWFTNSTYETLKDEIGDVDSLLGKQLIKKTKKTREYGADNTEAAEVLSNVPMLIESFYCMDAENRAAYLSAIRADQAEVDTVAKEIYIAITRLKLLPATDAYREIAKLIYAALGKNIVYSTDDDATIIVDKYEDLDNLQVNGADCAQFFNPTLCAQLGDENVDYIVVGESPNQTYFAFNNKLPYGYRKVTDENEILMGDECVEAILDAFDSAMRNETFTMDMERFVNDTSDPDIDSVKEQFLRQLSALELGKANFSLVISLVEAFLFNSSDINNPNREKALGSYNENADFFMMHWNSEGWGGNLGTDQYSNAYKYKERYKGSGFYDYTKYTKESLEDVIKFLYGQKENYTEYSIINTELYKTLISPNPEYKYNLQDYTEDYYGSLYNCAVTEQEKVYYYYRGLVDCINALELKPASNLSALNEVIAQARDIEKNKAMYDDVSAEGKEKWDTFVAKTNNALYYIDGTVLDEEEIAFAKKELEDAIKALILNVDRHAPILTIHNKQNELKEFHDAHPELKGLIDSADDMVVPSYMESGLGGYTLYVYTNQVSPHIVVSLADVTSKTSDDKIISSKPEKMSVKAQAMEGVSASVITPVFDEINGTAKNAQSQVVAGDNAVASVSTQSAKVQLKDENGELISGSYGYDETSSAYVILNPSFEGVADGEQSAVAYRIEASDSAVTKNYETGEITDANITAEQFNYADDTENLIDNVVENEITVFVYYMNAMPDDPSNDNGVVVNEDGTRTISTSAVLTAHEVRGVPENEWINGAMLYRTFAKPVKSWEFSETPRQLANKNASYYDPTFGKNNFGSFVYILDPDATSGFDYEVSKAYFENNADEAKKTFIELLNNDNAYIQQFNGYVESGTTSDMVGYKHYGAHRTVIKDNEETLEYESWDKSMGGIANGTLVFIHVADRFGNVCNRFIEWKNYDYITTGFRKVEYEEDDPTTLKPVTESTVVGIHEIVNDSKAWIYEDGGSGIANIDLFRYGGTIGSSLYIDYILESLKVQDSDSKIKYVSEDNSYVIATEEPNKIFTIAVTDHAGNVGSLHIRSDAEGKIELKVATASTNVAKYNANPASNVVTNSGEDLGVIEFTFNGNETVILNYSDPTSIVKAGPDGNVFANEDNVPLNIIAKAEVESIKLYDVDNGTEEIWTAENATVKDNGDGTNTWTVKYTFTEGEHNYKATAMVDGKWEANSADFNFTATTKEVIIEITPVGVGMGQISYNDGSVFSIVGYSKMTVPYGSAVKVNAVPMEESSKFYYWENDYTRRIISTAETMEFVAVTNMKLTPQFTTNEVFVNDKKLVVYVNNAENVVDSYVLADGDDYKVPAAPSLSEHVFKSWSMTKDEVLASEEKLIVVRPVYSLVVKNTVTLTEGNWTATGAGEYETIGNERPVATISASATDNAGAGFLYWLDAETGDIASYNRTYSFYVTNDTELTPVYGDASAVVPVPVARISTIKYDDKADKVSFFAERSVPTGYTLMYTGIVVTKSESVANDEEAFILDASGVSKGMSKSASANGYYSVSVSATSGETSYARAYIIYANADGDIITYYSPVSSYTA